jgi:hypothetical protein
VALSIPRLKTDMEDEDLWFAVSGESATPSKPVRAIVRGNNLSSSVGAKLFDKQKYQD